MNRRALLRGALAGTAAAAVPAAAAKAAPSERRGNVVIVGAGASGLYAADVLKGALGRRSRGERADRRPAAERSATDRQLYLEGPAACPKASRVAFGEVDLDIGAPIFIFPRIVRSHVTVFNEGPGKLIDLAISFDTGFPIPAVDRPTVTGTGILTKNPTLRGVPPPDKYVAVKSDLFHFFKITKGAKGSSRRRGLVRPAASGRTACSPATTAARPTPRAAGRPAQPHDHGASPPIAASRRLSSARSAALLVRSIAAR